MYALHILTNQAANGGQNYKQKKCTFHNHHVLKLNFELSGAKLKAGCPKSQDTPLKFNII